MHQSVKEKIETLRIYGLYNAQKNNKMNYYHKKWGNANVKGIDSDDNEPIIKQYIEEYLVKT